ncbi:uncharacterized protein LOC112503989 isoform X1 [Cynara cardunculus var. scolymus]|uniref:uncharacterized protein LOC112503989 isoform X1 n=1 Tax=Cynara cardunculus var. scolymus TaxID=59895 RepID=UPI000D62A1B8|nr:uncharacterized protein LOC112503989 isoform X1 [Cynara cardunculus var. scolymus]
MPNIFLLLYVHPIMNSGAGSKFSLNSSSQDGRSSSPYDDSTSVGALFEGTVSLQIPYFSLSLAKRDDCYFLLLLIEIESGTDSNLNISQRQLKTRNNGNEFDVVVSVASYCCLSKSTNGVRFLVVQVGFFFPYYLFLFFFSIIIVFILCF